MAPAVKAAFDAGVAFLAAGDFTKAELSFKKAIDPDTDSTAPLAFLAAVVRRGRQGSRGGERLADGAGRRHRLAADLSLAERRAAADARLRRGARDPRGGGRTSGRPTRVSPSRWPCSTARSAAGREAVRTLERYLDDRQDDRDAYFYAVQWLYTVHAGGAVVHNRAEDRRRAHDYADAYCKREDRRRPSSSSGSITSIRRNRTKK